MENDLPSPPPPINGFFFEKCGFRVDLPHLKVEKIHTFFSDGFPFVPV